MPSKLTSHIRDEVIAMRANVGVSEQTCIVFAETVQSSDPIEFGCWRACRC